MGRLIHTLALAAVSFGIGWMLTLQNPTAEHAAPASDAGWQGDGILAPCQPQHYMLAVTDRDVCLVRTDDCRVESDQRRVCYTISNRVLVDKLTSCAEALVELQVVRGWSEQAWERRRALEARRELFCGPQFEATLKAF